MKRKLQGQIRKQKDEHFFKNLFILLNAPEKNKGSLFQNEIKNHYFCLHH